MTNAPTFSKNLSPEEAFILIPKNHRENGNPNQSHVSRFQEIAAGSGIVASPLKDNQGYVLDFEGNLYGACNLQKIEQRIFHALDRQKTNYPTIARIFLSRSDLEENFLVVGIANRQTLIASLQSRHSSGEEEAQALKRGLSVDPSKEQAMEAWVNRQG